MTKDPSTLQNLLTRVEAATGPDESLNGDLATIFGWTRVPYPSSETRIDWLAPQGGSDPVPDPPDFTASIDAALALVERLLPGSIWQIHHHSMSSGEKGSPYCSINPNRIDDYAHEIFGSDGATAPLAILATLLKALIAQAGETA